MKNFTAIFSLLIYANVAFGVAVDYHYCNNKLASVSMLNFAGHCGCGSSSKGICKKCCRDTLRYAKADKHQSAQAFSNANWNTFHTQPCYIKNQSITIAGYNGGCLVTGHSKRCYSPPIYLLDKVFRI